MIQRQGTITFTYSITPSGETSAVTVNVLQKCLTTYYFNVSPTALTTDAHNNTVYLTVDTDSPHWTVSSTDNWITYVGQTGDTISFAVSENTGDTRQGSIVFRYESDNFGNTSTLDVGLTQQEPVYQITYHASSRIAPDYRLTPYIIEHTYSNGYGVIVLDESMTVLPYICFYNCTGLTEMTLPQRLLEIDDRAFSACTALSSITIPDSVTTIWYRAFSDCTALLSITIPDSVTAIHQETFSGCTALSSVTIGSGVTTIDFNAFLSCTALSSITIPDSVTTIGAQAFALCSSLSSIIIPDSVTTIGRGAFISCSSLTSITVMATTPPTLDDYAFYNTNNCPIYVPAASVTAYQTASGWSTYASRIQAIP